jgi:hypothetical protein
MIILIVVPVFLLNFNLIFQITGYKETYYGNDLVLLQQNAQGKKVANELPRDLYALIHV